MRALRGTLALWFVPPKRNSEETVMTKYFILMIEKFLNWGLKKFGADITQYNEIMLTKNMFSKSFKIRAKK